jgi:hypothetical protein
MIQNIFENVVYSTTISELDTFNKYREPFVNQLINLSKYVPLKPHVQSRGEASSTIFFPEIFKDLPGFKLLTKALMPNIEEARNILLPNLLGKLELIRGWANVMNKGSTTVSHTHQAQSDPYIVCIFYLEATKNSAQLVIINDDKENLECVDFPIEKLYYIPVHTGMLICHLNNVNHAVSEHLSDTRRISIMLEMKIVNK